MTIPANEYKIDLQTLRILDPGEWQKFFNYDKIETISADKKYKLISQRVFEQEWNTENYNEELYDLTTGTLLTSGSSIAFKEQKRESLLDRLYYSIKEKEEETRILDAKLTLEHFYLKELEELKNNDVILYYYDNYNTSQLSYKDNKFILSKAGKLLPNYNEWTSMDFVAVNRFNNLDEFWSEFIAADRWFMKYNPLNPDGRNSTKPLLLAKHVITFCNNLRKEHSFTYDEYEKLNQWTNLVWSDEYKSTEIKQWCSNCDKEVYFQGRYPKYICTDCASKEKLDADGNLLEFFNLDFSGGLKIIYKDKNGNTIREDDTQQYCDCIIDNKLYFAQEARFGGIVIQRKE